VAKFSRRKSFLRIEDGDWRTVKGTPVRPVRSEVKAGQRRIAGEYVEGYEVFYVKDEGPEKEHGGGSEDRQGQPDSPGTLHLNRGAAI